jgi:type IV secretory pathway TraG/TraD family ATPase VirD4
MVLADPEHAVLVLGPPRSGKTSALAVPNVVCAPGPVVATSTKPDLMTATISPRSEIGRCWLLDPTGTHQPPAGVTRIRWSPVAAACSWDESLVIARGMTATARPTGRRGEGAHWTERAEALVGPLLLAAYLDGQGMETVLRWVHRQDLDAPSAVLARHAMDTAGDVLCGISRTDPREVSGIWSTAAGVLAAYRADSVLDNSAAVNFDPRRMAGGRDTVYVCAPARHQELVAPIVVAFLDQVRSGCYEAWGRPSATSPMTLVLDELANIAPLPDLPALVSEGGSQGVLTLACLQDLSQARLRWGAAADGFLSLFGTKLVLGGIGDGATLELVSGLAGEVEIPARSFSRAPWWSPSRGAETVNWSTHRQRRLPPDAVNQLPPGTALMVAGSRPPEGVRLPPWWAMPVLAPSLESRGAVPARTIEM